MTEHRVEGPYDHGMQIERFALIWIALDEFADPPPGLDPAIRTAPDVISRVSLVAPPTGNQTLSAD